jgi:hypothetical protein
MDSSEMRGKRSYYIENHKWTEDEIDRFEEAHRKFPDSPTSNRQIAAAMGGSIHPNHVVYLKSQYRMKKRRLLEQAVAEVESEERAVPYESHDYSGLAASANSDLRSIVNRKKRYKS